MTLQRGKIKPLKLEDIIRGGFSTPWDAPLVPPFPFRFRNAEIITVFYRTDPRAISLLTPPPLKPIHDLVCVHIYKMNDPDWIGPYEEANIMFGAHFGNISGAFSPYLFLSSDTGLAHGREIHGQPKKFGRSTIEFRGDLIVGIVERNGIDVVVTTLPYKQKQSTLEQLRSYLEFTNNINLKSVDHIDGRPAIRQLTSRRLVDVTVHECWEGPCSVELRANVQAPVFRLPVIEPLHGFFWRADFTLAPGVILHDYLDQGHVTSSAKEI